MRRDGEIPWDAQPWIRWVPGATSALSVLARALGLHDTGAALVLRNELKAAGEGR